MLPIDQMRRLSRTVLAVSALYVCLGAHAAVPSATPFGIEPTGNFEPAAPLKGDGWQRLAANTKAKSSKAAGPAVPAASDIAPASGPPVLATSQVGAASAGAATVVASNAAAPAAWTVSATDGNYRQLIEAWATRAGWTAAPWELDKDLPIVGNDSFQGDFKAAVRHVLEATELTDYKVKPCFHSNNMVRVVKLTTKCDLTQ
ncbi:toxin co-regulated pilus biosynthesis Q family protein [Cupriavidus sp. D39]|uniref:toxin co-regulated pilus biosynthesis Q family protein n=1 Tax=Cupriavidus sp. D39 TaxID=2997877 RepID=UPI00226E99CF|nr:toxin co-regulated pilus biosynthesis Q family protein [Cupriavidus sp. D39]MCY0852663.1 toxin co-regulated pilus biosynthesis Q family protein [Cupriavidus sp. D39]